MLPFIEKSKTYMTYICLLIQFALLILTAIARYIKVVFFVRYGTRISMGSICTSIFSILNSDIDHRLSKKSLSLQALILKTGILGSLSFKPVSLQASAAFGDVRGSSFQ